jgi:hypothetical protein
MKSMKIIGLMLMALFALGAFTASAAMALEEGVLPNSNFTGTGTTQTLETLPHEGKAAEKIQCTALSILEGKFNAGSDDEGTANLHFTGCKAENLIAVNSLGDLKEVILAKVKFNVCLVQSAELKFGIAIEAIENPFHIEVPFSKELILVTGLVIAELEGAGTKGKEFKDKLKGTKGDQESALTCEALGKKFTYNYESANDSAIKDEHASQNGSFTLKFEKEVTFED